MELIYADHDMKELGMLNNPEYDLAFGEDENSFECVVSIDNHVCKEGYYIFAEGTEYGGIVDVIEIDSEEDTVTYSGRSWHGLLASKVILPLQSTDKDIVETTETTVSKSRLPEGYKEVEYIQSDGQAYIKSKYKPNSNTRVVSKFQFTSLSGYQYVYCARSSSSGSDRFGLLYHESGYFRSDYGATNVNFPTSIDCSAVYEADQNKNVCKVGNNTVTNTASTFQSALEMHLFAGNTGGEMSEPAKLKGWYFQISDNNGSARDYVACINPNEEVGMYDLITAEFYGNAGSGKFTAGAVIDTEETITETIPIVTLKRTDDEGTSLLNRYLIISGDANKCIKYILDRINLAPLFVVSEELNDVKISEYQFDRFADAYSGLCDMLASAGLRLKMTCEDNAIILSAVPVFDFSDGKELESDLIEYQMKKTYNTVNHLICIGSGKYEDRQIVHLYLDAEGNVSETQTFSGVDERIQFDGEQEEPEEEEEEKTSEQLAEEREKLIESGTKKLLDLQAADEIEVDFDSDDDMYYVGDIVGAYDSKTDISVAAAVSKKIVTIKRGIATITYEVKGDTENG